MRRQQHRPWDAAQSEVIGTVLMVGIVVILAAVISVFALGFGQVAPETPQASFSFDYDEDDDELTITHTSGDVLDRSALSVVSDDGSATQTSNWPDAKVGAGDQFVAGDITDDETVRVVWTDDSGSQSATLGKWVGPDA